jgi:hypothetical protein
MTQAAFLNSYGFQLMARHEWARNADKLSRFLDSCAATLHGANTWNHDSPAVTAAWRTIGGKGKPSLKALRALAS